MYDRFKAMFSKPPKNTYILVKEGNFGMETYVNDYVRHFNRAYKKSMITFLEGIIAMLKEGDTPQEVAIMEAERAKDKALKDLESLKKLSKT